MRAYRPSLFLLMLGTWWVTSQAETPVWPDAPWQGEVIIYDAVTGVAVLENPAGRPIVRVAAGVDFFMQPGARVRSTLHHRDGDTWLTDVWPDTPDAFAEAAQANRRFRLFAGRESSEYVGEEAVFFDAAGLPVHWPACLEGKDAVIAWLPHDPTSAVAQRVGALWREALASGFGESTAFVAFLTPGASAPSQWQAYFQARDWPQMTGRTFYLLASPELARRLHPHWQQRSGPLAPETGLLLRRTDGQITHRWLGSAWQPEVVIAELRR